VIQIFPETAALNTDSGGCITLRIGVDKEYPIAPTGDHRRQINCGRSFSDSAFLVCDGYRFGHLLG
jgi:hypothetical protein